MSETVVVYGKDTCPFTQGAIDALKKNGKEYEYHNVQLNPEKLEIMLKLTDGRRQVPVTVEGDNVTIGFRGRN